MSKYVTITAEKRNMVVLETICNRLNVGFHVEANINHSNTLTFRLLKKDHKKIIDSCDLLE